MKMYSKREVDSNKCAILVSSSPYNRAMVNNIYNGDERKLFPDYLSTDHIIVERELSFPVYDKEKGEIREMTDPELALTGNRELRIGETIENETLVVTDAPEFHVWKGGVWVDDSVNILETRREMARKERTRLWRGLDIFDAKIAVGRMTQTEEEKLEIDLWYEEWSLVPNNYTDLSISIESTYPEATPKKILEILKNL